ncbi:hypothetical protein ACIBTZ_13460 [Micromonospora sp. NPDC049460]|uniref:hypothetical protein n=1 Tax=Micromonospora sp. NPDC049460 TaxID=3364272 RepID=UPI0037AA170A
MMRRIAVAVTAVAALVGVAGAPAQAAVNPYTPEAVCGVGYTRIDQDPIRKDTGELLGTLHLLRNNLTGYACVVTLKSAYVGVATRTGVYADTDYASPVQDEGLKFYYAGPAKTYVGLGGCVLWGGSMADSSGTVWYHARANPAIGGIVTCGDVSHPQ